MEDSKSDEETQSLTPEERKQHVEKEQKALEKEVEELLTWTDMIEGMNEAQLKNYLKNRPKHLKTAKREKIGKSIRFKGMEKCKRSGSSGIMGAVWKFHQEGGDGSF